MWPPPHPNPPTVSTVPQHSGMPAWDLRLDFLPEDDPAHIPAPSQTHPLPPSMSPIPPTSPSQPTVPPAYPHFSELDIVAMLSQPPAAQVQPAAHPQPHPHQPTHSTLGSQLLDSLQYAPASARAPNYGSLQAPQRASGFDAFPAADVPFPQTQVQHLPLQPMGSALRPPPQTLTHPPGSEHWATSFDPAPFSVPQNPFPSNLDGGETSHPSWPAAWPDPADFPPGPAAECAPVAEAALHAPTSSTELAPEDSIALADEEQQSSSGAVKAVRGAKLKSRTGRRQNSACDACRASKKGCDLQVNVTYNDIGVTVRPLIKCSTCKRRGIECTTHEVHLIKSANGHFRPNGALSATAQARLAALSSSLSASMGTRSSSLMSPTSSQKRQRATDLPSSPASALAAPGSNAMPSVLLTPGNDVGKEVKAEKDGSDERLEEGPDASCPPSLETSASSSVSLFKQLEALSSIPGTSRTIASINRSSMSSTLVSRTLSLYSSIMEGPMTLWLSYEVSDAKPVFSVDEIQRRLLLAGPGRSSASQTSSTPGSDATTNTTNSRNQSDEVPGHSSARRLLGILKDARASWAEWTSSGSSLGIGLADAEGTDSSTPGATPNLVFVATILDAAFETDLDPAQAGRDFKNSWAQRARWRLWVRSIDECTSSLLT